MQKRIITLIFTVIGGSIGYSFTPLLWHALKLNKVDYLNNYLVNILLGAIIFFLLSFLFVKPIENAIKKLDHYIRNQSVTYLLFGSLGTIIGLILAYLISSPLYKSPLPVLNIVVPILILIIFGLIGFRIGTLRRDEWRKLIQTKNKKGADGEILNRNTEEHYHRYKILDTSVIIDGRIYDIAKTGFIEGTLMIPNFVLKELQFIADSSDNLKRARGRRGLDILNALQKEEDISVEMYDGDFEDIPEVDSKLIKLAKLLDGIVVTNDYNLNKVSQFQNVPVFNINALANAVKPVVIPGEKMNVFVVKAGTERQQGVAYLDDGTMIVVEDGQYYMNQHIEVIVTSALQTAAGRMIFAKPAHSQRTIDDGQTDETETHKK